LQTLLNILWNPIETRPRLAWRLAGLGILSLALLPLFQAAATSAASLFFPSFAFNWNDPLTLFTLTLASGLALAASVALAARLLDRRPIRDLGLRLSHAWWTDFGLGFILGAALMTGVFMVELALGWVEIEGFFHSPPVGPSFPTGLVLGALFYITIGFYEEFLTRGYLVKNLAEGFSGKLLGPRGAILLAWILTSAFFGFLHAANPNATPFATLNIALAGLLLGSGYIVTGELAVPIGLHISWNFFQGQVFGFPVSGASFLGASIINIQQAGPWSWTGGPFGPEGGLIGTLTILLGLAIIIRWKGRNGLHLNLTRYQPRQARPDHQAGTDPAPRS
jgi:membrane protease YdiL (CAAX protease family)